jgi:rSAM/selenodomain-associated transferase 1
VQRLQEGEDLGARLKQAFSQAFDENVKGVVVMGSDSPTVPLECINEAFDELSHHDVVLGPALDGGYYLLGSSRYVPDLFEHISWGSPTVLQETVDALQRAGSSYSLLIEWYDIDTAEDLARLREEITYISRNHPAQIPNRVVEALSDQTDL